MKPTQHHPDFTKKNLRLFIQIRSILSHTAMVASILGVGLVYHGGILGITATGVYPVAAAASDETTINSKPASPFHIYLPMVGDANANGTQQAQPLTEDTFAAQVVNGEGGMVRGAFVQGTLALKVLQQPSGNSSYIAFQPGVATQFSSADRYGVIGLLAHNTLSGKSFFELKPGDMVTIIYGDGTREHYQVTAIDQFQATEPTSTSTSFIDLESGDTLSAGQVFVQEYTGDDHVTFQTCISRNGVSSWGRLFVIAEPVS